MKRKRIEILSFTVFLFSIIVFCSCNETTELTERNDNLNCTSLSIEEKTKLSSSIIDLTSDDAAKVAGIFNSNNNKVRSFSTFGSVKNVVTIPDGNGDALIYAVNYQNGYILISATRKFYPILAVIENGNFTLESLTSDKSGRKVVLNDIIESIKAAKSGEITVNCEAAWSEYIEKENFEESVITRSQDDDYWAAYDKWYDEISSMGDCVIRKLKYCSGILPDNVYNNFVEAASDEDHFEGTKYSWENTAYVVEETIYNREEIAPLLSTLWSQNHSFNSTPYENLGCVTVAVGQLMRYYQKPSNFNWADMPDAYGNTTLQNFLARLRSELKVSAEGGANIGDAERVLKSYGYSITKINHDATQILYSIRKRKPVYARGIDEIDKKGHAWVIDGLYNSSTIVKYTLYRLADYCSPNFKYVDADIDPYQDYSEVVSFHMNWGWGGNYNGFYLDTRPWILDENYTYKYKYSKDRKEIIFN